MNSLSDIYDLLKTKIADIDVSKILVGTNIFGKAGTMPDHTGISDFTPGVDDIIIPTGFYDGITKILGDANLVSDNIKSGVNIFGVDGSLLTNPLYGDNDANKVLNTASNPGSYDANTCSTTYNTLNLSSSTVKSGVAFGNSQTGAVIESLGDAVATDVLAGKYFSNATNANILGTLVPLDTSDATASVGDILSPKTAYVNGIKLTGTMVDRGATSYTPSNVAQTILAGYYNGSGTVATDANLITGNILAGKTIFGVAGSASVVNTSDATAGVGDILLSKTAYVNGVKITGNASAGTNYSLPKTGQTSCWDAAGTVISCTCLLYTSPSPRD